MAPNLWPGLLRHRNDGRGYGPFRLGPLRGRGLSPLSPAIGLDDLAGTISKKMAPAVVRLYEQMPAPKWVIAMGNCAISGGPFYYPNQYAIIPGAV